MIENANAENAFGIWCSVHGACMYIERALGKENEKQNKFSVVIQLVNR